MNLSLFLFSSFGLAAVEGGGSDAPELVCCGRSTFQSFLVLAIGMDLVSEDRRFAWKTAKWPQYSHTLFNKFFEYSGQEHFFSSRGFLESICKQLNLGLPSMSFTSVQSWSKDGDRGRPKGRGITGDTCGAAAAAATTLARGPHALNSSEFLIQFSTIADSENYKFAVFTCSSRKSKSNFPSILISNCDSYFV